MNFQDKKTPKQTENYPIFQTKKTTDITITLMETKHITLKMKINEINSNLINKNSMK